MTVAAADSGAGVWTLERERRIIADADGPATLLVPSERLLLLAVDLPLPSRSQRLAALPFAIEDRIADPLDSVHLAIGETLGPQQYLVAVVRHSVMAEWVALAEANGLGNAALVPDALALPRPGEGAWNVAQRNGRAVVRAGDGTGFAVPAALLPAAWDAAGRPLVTSFGDALPDAFAAEPAVPQPLGMTLAVPALDLRQGPYARRSVGSTFARKLAMVGLAALVAHGVIAAADTLMLRAIADRREAETRTLLATAAPDLAQAEDLQTSIADRLPRATGDNRFVPALGRVSAALAPLAPAIAVRSIQWSGSQLAIDLDAGDAGAAERLRTALSGARIDATVTPDPAGGIRVTAAGA
ncbi:type II secretion system protein GspL [Sphingomonas sp. PL-96]|uniref:type II secretion system protein GspL n=1 Tax=Sphingomonas sp. PL-96 TaxID=2887201 RepID=UPI001E332F1D|nr:type II secretion system protein GspL [Sphingomonas sp. PL-96]MCC2977845.1 type II secretion system protein GspL [Sphingomonas sp. PL-96]